MPSCRACAHLAKNVALRLVACALGGAEAVVCHKAVIHLQNALACLFMWSLLSLLGTAIS